MATKNVTLILHMTVPDEYDNDDLNQIAKEIVAEIHRWPVAGMETVEDWEYAESATTEKIDLNGAQAETLATRIADATEVMEQIVTKRNK